MTLPASGALAKLKAPGILLARGVGNGVNGVNGRAMDMDESLRGDLFRVAVIRGFPRQGLYQVFKADDDML